MPSPRLRLWQVLRDEYESFHDARPEVIADWSFQRQELRCAARLACRLRAPAEAVSKKLRDRLKPASREELQKLKDAQPLSDALLDALVNGLNTLLDDPELYQEYDQQLVARILAEAETGIELAGLKSQALSGDRLRQVNRWLLEETYPDEIEGVDGRLTAAYYKQIHPKNHSAVCLSGGGIRSATFNLGIAQGLARHGLLEQFDYLSTVSGGGYTGGWLSAWIQRQGLKKVVAQLSSPPTSPVEPEPKPLTHLRAFSNYLSPRLGLTSADTWTMVATLLRNIFLNWLVLIPILVALLLAPRIWLSFLYGRTFESVALSFKSSFGFPLSLVIGFVATVIALTYIGRNLPSTNWKSGDGRRFWWWGLLPLMVAAMAFATFWARAENRLTVSWWTVVQYAWATLIIPVLICFGYRWVKAKDKLGALWQILGAVVLIAIAQFIAGWLAWLGATRIVFFAHPHDHIILYSCFALPLLLGLLMLAGTLLSGLTSRYTEDDDQEWWARSGAVIYIVSLAWIIMCALVLYGPYLFKWLADWQTNSQYWIGRLGAIAGALSGAVSLFGGFSAKTPASEQEAKKAGGGGLLLQAATRLLGPIFLAFIFILLSFAAGALLTLTNYLPAGMQSLLFVDSMPTAALQHVEILLNSPVRLLAVLCVLLTALGLLTGRAISTNKFSLHYFWRNRIIRAYLGASHEQRRPNPFTGFDTDDNIYMHELRPFQPGSPIKDEDKPPHRETKLLHVLGVALNLAGSKRLVWQERKAESFTISPLHAGNYRLGYRKALAYGRQPYNGKQGISLGTAVAISGAFASPNMGYMMSSPIVRFLMTLFNVRFGWWLGNPGRAGDAGLPFNRTYDRDSPRLSVTPILQEALGQTDDTAPYVYLSDGGHFENYGLYEMVLRRCRTIVVGDGSSDENYSFQSLGLAIRQIRVDLGVPIEFSPKQFHITGRSLEGKGAYGAVGKIRYSCVDGGGEEADGVLILIKAALVGDEPRDVLNYAREHDTFPQEFIGDQWFTESQFESYRALGSHIVDALCRVETEIDDHNTFPDLQTFGKNLGEQLAKVSLTDFEHSMLDILADIPKSIREEF